jgi:hypothetical protein
MVGLVRKIHIYAGLLTLAHLAVYGLAGLVATFHAPGERPKPVSAVRYVPFTAPPSSTDKQVAALVYQQLKQPMTRPMPDWFLRQTPDHHLLLDFYNINGIRRVVVLENEGRLRLEDVHNNNWLFIEDIHAATPGDQDAPTLVRLWAWWNEAAMWSLLLFCVSGAWLWLATRRRYVWAWVALAGGTLSFAILWEVFR